MMSWRWLLISIGCGALPTACGGTLPPCDGETDSPCDDDAPADRDVYAGDLVAAEIVATYPEEGSTDLFYRDPLWVEFDGDPTKASLELRRDGGGRVPGSTTWSEDHRLLTFDPYGTCALGKLRTATAYTATISYAGHDDLELHFETSGACSPLGWAAQDPVGRDYLVELSAVHVLEPLGAWSLLSQYIGDVEAVLHFASLDDDAHEAELVLGTVERSGLDHVQDPCVPTFPLTEEEPGLWDEPYVQVGPVDILYSSGGYETTFHDLRLAGCFSQDAESFHVVHLDGQLDTRVFDDLIDPGAAEGAFCELADSLGAICEECVSGEGPYCVTVRAGWTVTEEVSLSTADPVTGEVHEGLMTVTADQIAQWEAAGVCDGDAGGCGACAVSTPRPPGPCQIALIPLGLLALARRRSSGR